MGQGSQSGSQGQGKQGEGQQGGAKSAGGQPNGGKGSGKSASNGGMGKPGTGGVGGKVGAQQPLPGAKKDSLVQGAEDPNGQKLSRHYKGTPDPVKDRAAYYQVVPEKTRAAEASLNREEIPTGYKKQVKDYFEAIQPQ